MLELRHIADSGAYTRTYDIATDSNRLLSTYLDPATYSYSYDVRGNMTEMPHLDAMHWNLNNELHQIENGTMEAYYQYSGGQRVRKFVDKGSVKEERIYLGNFEIYRKLVSGVLDVERTTIHVSDDTGRIAMLEVDHPIDEYDYDVEPPLTRYIYSNHLQSASLELDEEGEIISYEEYHPYGTTSYQAMNASINAVAKRYRYTGKERDEESGLYYHGARYYIPWLARWTAVDPLEAKYAGMSPYNYGFNNPVIYNDPSGMSGETSGLWIESFNAQTNTRNLAWVKGADTYEDAINNATLSKGYDFTGNYYERFAYNNGEGTVFGLSDGSTIYPSNNYYSGTLRNIAKDGAIYTFDKFTEAKVKGIIEHNKTFGIKVDNFGTVRQSPRMYNDYFSKGLLGQDVWINQGGSSSRGPWTTRLSAWQDPFSNYMTPNAMKWSNSAKLFSEGLGILGGAISIAEVAKGGSPLGLLPIPVEMIVNKQAKEMENGLFEFAINNESFDGMIRWIEASKKNTKAPLYEFYQQLRFVYTTNEQVNILNKGQLNVTNPYFSYPNESTTKATLIHVQGNNFSILKTYDFKK